MLLEQLDFIKGQVKELDKFLKKLQDELNGGEAGEDLIDQYRRRVADKNLSEEVQAMPRIGSPLGLVRALAAARAALWVARAEAFSSSPASEDWVCASAWSVMMSNMSKYKELFDSKSIPPAAVTYVVCFHHGAFHDSISYSSCCHAYPRSHYP